MRYKLIFIACLALSAATFSQESNQLPHVTVKVLPPELFPSGTCKADASGYLAITKNEKENIHLSDKQLGEYIRVRLSQGYSVALYPQISGRIFSIATCESKTSVASQ
jgi:hypothetical protein